MNLTISVDERMLAKARMLAARQGTSVQRMIRDYLASLVSDMAPEDVAAELIALMTEHGGSSEGRPYQRADAYDGRT